MVKWLEKNAINFTLVRKSWIKIEVAHPKSTSFLWIFFIENAHYWVLVAFFPFEWVSFKEVK